MKKKLLILFAILLASPVFAATEVYNQPYNATFTTISELGKSLTTIRTELAIKSCYADANWQAKACDYMYYCYAILPSSSTSIADALRRECVDATNKSTVTLQIKDFVPPKGVLYAVTTFIVKVHYTYSSTTDKWTPVASIPSAYIKTHGIRNTCPSGQMLDLDTGTGDYRCYIAKRICLDTMNTGLCTNTYTLWALDKNQNGVVDENETKMGASLCADRPSAEYPNGDGICDLVKDLGCVDNCAKYDKVGESLTCTTATANGLCDEWDMAAWYSCVDEVLSQNSKICDDIDAVCPVTYNPVCVGGAGGRTYPNSCFAIANGYNLCGVNGTSCYIAGACEPPITQCYVAEDCYSYAKKICIGGSVTGITSMCLDYMCSFSGACSNLACNTNADCASVSLPCVGPSVACVSGFCSIEGKCMTQPQPTSWTIWDLIQSIWTAFWNFIKSIFGL